MGKINPRNVPVSQSDVKRAFNEGVKQGVSNACAIFLTVMLDKFGASANIKEIWNQICKLSEEISEHRITLSDLRYVLLKEYDINV